MKYYFPKFVDSFEIGTNQMKTFMSVCALPAATSCRKKRSSALNIHKDTNTSFFSQAPTRADKNMSGAILQDEFRIFRVLVSHFLHFSVAFFKNECRIFDFRVSCMRTYEWRVFYKRLSHFRKVSGALYKSAWRVFEK